MTQYGKSFYKRRHSTNQKRPKYAWYEPVKRLSCCRCGWHGGTWCMSKGRWTVSGSLGWWCARGQPMNEENGASIVTSSSAQLTYNKYEPQGNNVDHYQSLERVQSISILNYSRLGFTKPTRISDICKVSWLSSAKFCTTANLTLPFDWNNPWKIYNFSKISSDSDASRTCSIYACKMLRSAHIAVPLLIHRLF